MKSKGGSGQFHQEAGTSLIGMWIQSTVAGVVFTWSHVLAVNRGGSISVRSY